MMFLGVCFYRFFWLKTFRNQKRFLAEGWWQVLEYQRDPECEADPDEVEKASVLKKGPQKVV